MKKLTKKSTKKPTLWWNVYIPVGKKIRFLRPTRAVSAIEARCNVWWTNIVPQYGREEMEDAKAVLPTMVARLAIQRKPKVRRAKRSKRRDRRQPVLFFLH